MALVRKKWHILSRQTALERQLAQEVQVSPLTAGILLNRGIREAEEARKFLWASLTDLNDPYLLKDMIMAIDRIKEAILKEEPILVFGDYDVDGITGTSLLLLAIGDLGGKVDYYLPNRLTEGYGLNVSALKEAATGGYRLLITVDCGITSVKEIAAANQLGLDVIVTDHHQPQEEIPPALAVINPKQGDCMYPYKELAGVGVAFKMVQALGAAYGKDQNWWRQFLDLVALGTVADVVPILDENRILVKHGLSVLQSAKRVGIKALLETTGLEGKELTPGHIGFILGPRLNAAGRLGNADRGVKLLLAAERAEALDIARELDLENRERQALESAIFSQAKEMIANEVDLERDRVIVLGAKEWHTGVIGIVASRLVELFYRPTVLVGFADGLGKGSARSIKGFHIFDAFDQCSDLLLNFGGHSQAAGLSIEPANLPLFRERLNRLAWDWLEEEDFYPVQTIDAEINLAELSFTVLDELESLAPFGPGNPEPVLASSGIQLLDCRGVGEKKNHLKIKALQSGCELDGIGFRMGDLMMSCQEKKWVDLAYTLQSNQWQGKTSLQMVLRDIRDSQISLRNSDKLPLWQINDRRGQGNIDTLLESLKDENGLIFVTSGRQAEAVGQLLRQRLPQGIGVAVFHAGLSKREQDRILHSLLQGTIQILVSTSFIPLGEGLRQIRQIVWLDLNFNPFDFRRLCYLIGKSGEPVIVTLLYGAGSKGKNEKIINGLVPEPSLVRTVYGTLKKMGMKGSQVLRQDNLYKQLQEQPVDLPAYTLNSILEVLHDLGLVKYEKNNHISLLEKGDSGQIKVASSKIYRQKAKERDTYLAFQEFLVSASIESIKDFLDGQNFSLA